MPEVTYTDDLSGVDSPQLDGFFVGWPQPPSPEQHLALLRGSYAVVLARDETARVVGFVNAISDGVLSAYIPLLEVLPSHHGRGIGSELMRRLLARLDTFYMVDLVCDAELEPFYRRLGLSVWDRWMGMRNPRAIAGAAT